MARPEPDFALDELYALLAQEPEADDSGGMRVTELCDVLHCSPKSVRDRLRVLLANGKVERCRKSIVSLAGRRTRVPAYRVADSESIE